MILPAIISGIASVVSNILGNQMQYSQQQSLMDKSQQQTLERMNLENDYNNPINQKSRLVAAGLNPNLLYGSLPNQSSSPSPSGTPLSTFIPPLNGFDGVLSSVAQQQLLSSQIALNNSEAQLNLSKSDSETANTQIAYANLSLDEKRFAMDLERSCIQNSVDTANVAQIRAQIALIAKQIEAIPSSIALNNANARKASADAILTNLKSDTWLDEVSANIRAQLSSANLSNKQASFIQEQIIDLIRSREPRLRQIILSNHNQQLTNQKLTQELHLMSVDLAKSLRQEVWMNDNNINFTTSALDLLLSTVGSLLRPIKIR